MSEMLVKIQGVFPGCYEGEGLVSMAMLMFSLSLVLTMMQMKMS
jgi:hypothetical protein